MVPLPRLASMSPDELRGAMRGLGYRTQSDLAGATGVSRSTVGLWVEGNCHAQPVRGTGEYDNRRPPPGGDAAPHGDRGAAPGFLGLTRLSA